MRNMLRGLVYAGAALAALAVVVVMHAAGGRGVEASTALVAPSGLVESTSVEPQALALLEDAAPALCGRCGDGACVRSCGETPTSCPRDCGVPSESLCGRCGDGACVRQCGETATSCPRDCAPAGETLRVEEAHCGAG
jgi:hypothetical protein